MDDADDLVVPAPPKPLRLPVLLWRGIARRCPLCGSGGCFRSFLHTKDRCPRCNFSLQRTDAWIGAIGINTVATLGLLVVTLGVSIGVQWEDRRAAWVFGPCLAVALLVPFLFYGSSQTLWGAIDLAMRPVEPEDDVDPRWIPPPKAPPTGW